MKLAPFCDAIARNNKGEKVKINYIIMHTGQQYDVNKSDDFFDAVYSNTWGSWQYHDQTWKKTAGGKTWLNCSVWRC